MAKTVVLNIKVNDEELDQLQSGLKELGADFSVIEKGAEKTRQGFKKIGKSSIVFQQINKWTGGLAGNLVDVYNGLGKVNTGLKVTRGALLATGVGAFVVALGLVVEYWDDIVEFITQANKRIQTQIDASNTIQENLAYELELLELKEKILEAEGKSTKEIVEQKKIIIASLQAENLAELGLLEIQKQRILGQIQEITLWEQIKSIATGQRGLVLPTEEEATKLEEITDQIKDAKKQALELELELAKINNPKVKGEKRGREKKIGTFTGEDADAQKEKELKLFDELFGLKDAQNQAFLEQNQAFLDSKEVQDAISTQKEIEQARLREEARIAELETKDEILQAEGDLLYQFSDLLAVFGEENKALAVASIITEQIASAAQIISATGIANAKAAAASPITGGQPWVTINTISAGLSIATGAAAAAKAISQLGGGGGSSSGGSSPAAAPTFNVVGNSPENQLNQALLDKQTQPVEAFVVEGSVSSAQSLRRNKVESSSIG